MKITKSQLQQVIREAINEEMGGGIPDKAAAEELLDDILSDLRQNAASPEDAKKAAAAEALLTVMMGGPDAEGVLRDMFPDGMEAFREEYGV